MRQQNNNNSLSVGKAARLYTRLMKAVAAEPVTMAEFLSAVCNTAFQVIRGSGVPKQEQIKIAGRMANGLRMFIVNDPDSARSGAGKQDAECSERVST